MSNLVINTGSSPNDGTGDSLLVGATKINSNFSEIYGALGPGTNLSVGFGRTVISIQSGTLNVGIGTSAPGATFHVNPNSTGIAGLFSGSTSNDMVRITQLGTGNAFLVEDFTNPDSSPFVIDQAGNTGIGTTLATYRLTVTDASSSVLKTLSNVIADFTGSPNSYNQVNTRNSNSGNFASADYIVTADTGTDSTNYLDLGINNSGFSTSSWTINGALDGYLYTSNNNLSVGVATTGKYLSFFAGGTLASNEQMRVTTSGVGIGTTIFTGTVSQALQVGGGAYISAGAGSSVGIGTTNPTRKVHIWGDGTSSPYEINLTLSAINSSGFGPYFGLNGSSLSGGRNWHVSSGGNLDLAGVGKFSISDTTANASRLVIDSVGNVGIGTTIPTSRLWVNDNAFFTGIITATSTVVGSAVTISSGGINVTGVTTSTSAIVGSAVTISSGGINVTGIVTAITVVTQPGTATTVPLLFNAGTITTPNATPGGVEYDGQSFYATGVSTSGRGLVPVQQSYRLNANRGVIVAGLAYTNYFDPATLPLASAGAHEVEFELYFNKGTIGITTFTISTPSATSNINAILTTSPQAGLTTNSTGAVTTVFPQMIGIVGTALTSVGLGLTLPSGNNYAKLSVFVENAAVTNNSLTLNVTNTNSTFQPLRGSRFKSTLLARTVSIGITG